MECGEKFEGYDADEYAAENRGSKSDSDSAESGSRKLQHLSKVLGAGQAAEEERFAAYLSDVWEQGASFWERNFKAEIRISCLQEEAEEAGREGEPEEAEDPFPSATLPLKVEIKFTLAQAILA